MALLYECHHHSSTDLFHVPKLKILSSTFDLHMWNLDFLNYYHGKVCGLISSLTQVIHWIFPRITLKHTENDLADCLEITHENKTLGEIIIQCTKTLRRFESLYTIHHFLMGRTGMVCFFKYWTELTRNIFYVSIYSLFYPKVKEKLLSKQFPVPSYTHFLLTDIPTCPKHSLKRGFCVFHSSISRNTIF